jgi:hypothetical protein
MKELFLVIFQTFEAFFGFAGIFLVLGTTSYIETKRKERLANELAMLRKLES